MPSPWMHLCKWRKAVCRTARTSSRMMFIMKRRSPFWKNILPKQLPCPCETQGDSHHSHCPFCPSDTGLHSSSTATMLGLRSAPQRLLPTASLFSDSRLAGAPTISRGTGLDLRLGNWLWDSACQPHGPAREPIMAAGGWWKPAWVVSKELRASGCVLGGNGGSRPAPLQIGVACCVRETGHR